MLGLDDWDNLYADRTSIATLIKASRASDNDDWWERSTAEKKKVSLTISSTYWQKTKLFFNLHPSLYGKGIQIGHIYENYQCNDQSISTVVTHTQLNTTRAHLHCHGVLSPTGFNPIFKLNFLVL